MGLSHFDLMIILRMFDVLTYSLSYNWPPSLRTMSDNFSVPSPQNQPPIRGQSRPPIPIPGMVRMSPFSPLDQS